MKRLRDAWAVLRGRKRAVARVPFRNPFMLDQSVIGWRYVVNNELLADLVDHEPVARAISKQAARDVYVKVCELALDHASERRA